MGTPPCLQNQKSVVMHRLIYKWSQARGSLRLVPKIRLVDISIGEKSPSGFSLDPPHSAARHLTPRHDLNNLNPVSSPIHFHSIQLTTLLTTIRPSTSLSAIKRQRYLDSRIVPSFRYSRSLVRAFRLSDSGRERVVPRPPTQRVDDPATCLFP